MSLPPLTNAELAIMELLWDHDSLTARQVREQLYPDAEKAQHGTVQRLLQRLEDKGFVRRDKHLPVHLFQAATSRDAYAGTQLESLADRLTGGSIAPFLTHLLGTNRLDPADISRLRRLLDEAQEGDAP